MLKILVNTVVWIQPSIGRCDSSCTDRYCDTGQTVASSQFSLGQCDTSVLTDTGLRKEDIDIGSCTDRYWSVQWLGFIVQYCSV